MDSRLNELLGKGIAFPLTLDSTGKAEILDGKELIKHSIINILSWNYGRRYFLGEYGSKVEQLIEKPLDYVTLDLVREFVIEVITRWEKRITLKQVSIEVQNESVLVYLKYEIIADNSVDSFIIPFYSQIRH
jgi:uncharacterized protein